MPRGGPPTYTYSLPAIYLAIPGTLIIATQHNTPLEDIATTLNDDWPVNLGGTGGTTAAALLATQNRFTATQSWDMGADIASAATLVLGTDGNTFHVTGTTGITAVTSKDEGTWITLVFDDALTLTHNDTSLILPGGANITTAAGDTGVFVSEGSGNWRCLAYQKASGQPISGDRSNAPVNMQINAGVSSNNVTIAVLTHAGGNPTATSPVLIPFRSVVANDGDITVLSLVAANSLVVPSGATLGTTNGAAATLTVVGFNDGGTFRLGIINANGKVVADGIASSTAIGTGSDSVDVFYTGSAVTSKAYTVLGYITITEATAGTWATAPTRVQTGTAPATALAVLPFTKFFESAEQTITAGGSLTLAHGLGVEPKLVQALLVCQVADLGYSVGDKVVLNNHMQGNTTGNGGQVLVPDGTNVFVRFNDTPSTYRMNNKSTGSGASGILNTSWRLIVRAWA